MIGRKVAVRDAHVLVLGSGRVEDLNVGRHVTVTICLAKVVEVLIRDLAHVKLMIPGGENIVVNPLVSC